MLGVLDTESPVALAVSCRRSVVNIEYLVIRPIADGVDVYLQTGVVGLQNIFWRLRDVFAGQSGRFRIVQIRIKKPSRRRAEAAVGVALEASHANHCVAERISHTG